MTREEHFDKISYATPENYSVKINEKNKSYFDSYKENEIISETTILRMLALRDISERTYMCWTKNSLFKDSFNNEELRLYDTVVLYDAYGSQPTGAIGVITDISEKSGKYKFDITFIDVRNVSDEDRAETYKDSYNIRFYIPDTQEVTK